MIPDDALKAQFGMFADVEPKPVVQTPESLENEGHHTLTLPTISFDSLAMMSDSFQKLGRSLKSTSGGISISMMVIDDCETLLRDEETFKDIDIKTRFLEMATNGYHDGVHHTMRGRILLPKIPKNKAEIEAFKTKSRGRLIGRKGW